MAGLAAIGVAGLVVVLLPGSTGQSAMERSADASGLNSAGATGAATAPGFTVHPATASGVATGKSGKQAATGGAVTIDYLDHAFTVPASWRIVNLAKNPATCVRFDSNTVYLGTPGTQEDCPASGAGRTTEAMLIQPSTGDGAASSSVADPTSRQISTIAQGVQITASYATDEAQVAGVIRGAGLPEPVVSTPAPKPAPATTSGTAPSAMSAASATSVPSTPSSPSPTAVASAGPVNQTVIALMTRSYTGLGFDACTAPSSVMMTAWSASPYSAVGIYIGGVDRFCAQPDLTTGWVTAEAQAGWHFMPIYVGPQVADGDITSPAAQGIAAADDAVVQAQAIGIGYGALIYYDMEAYDYTPAQNTTVVAFMNAWTIRLHQLDYLSAAYGTETGVEGASAAAYGTIVEPDVIDVANWNSQADDDPGSDPSGYWTGRRVHQFDGGTDDSPTYGGVTINIDQDYLGLTAVNPPCTSRTAPTPTSTATSPVRTDPIGCSGIFAP